MRDPQRLLDQAEPSLAQDLLRSGQGERPPSGALQRALGVAAAAAASAAAAGTAGATVASAALVKGILIWTTVGAVSGAAISFTAREISTRTAAPALTTPSSSKHPSPAAARAVNTPVAAPTAANLSRRLEVSQPSSSSSVDRLVPPALAESRRAVPSSPERTRPEASSTNFADELVLLDRARQQLAAGSPAEALSQLARYRAAYPAGHFLPEALALAVEAHAGLGEGQLARTLAERFISRYPQHPLAARVRAVLDPD